MLTRPLLALALLLTAPATAVAAPTTLPYINGIVYDTLVDGDTLYVGGAFDVAGTAAGPLVLARGDDGSVQRTFPGFGSAGWDEEALIGGLLPDGDGGWYAGGGFSRVNGAQRSAFVHLRADGSVDPAFNPVLRFGVFSLARHGDVLWVNGWAGYEEETPEDERGPRLLAVDARSGATLPMAPTVGAGVTDLALADGRLYVATQGDGVRAFDAATGADTGWQVAAGKKVAAIDVRSGVVYATGAEGVIGYRAADGVALPQAFPSPRKAIDVVTTERAVFVACDCWGEEPSLRAYDRTSGQAIELDSRTFAEHLAAGGGRVYAGGPDGYQAFDGTTGARVPWAVGVRGSRPYRLAVAPDGTVAIGGTNGAVGGATRRNLAAFDMRTGALLPFNPDLDTPYPDKWWETELPKVWSLRKVGDRLFAGGAFTRVGGVARKNLAALDARTGALLPFPESRDVLTALGVADGKLIAGGRALQAFDLGTDTKLPWEAGAEWYVRSIEVVDDTLVVGGSFMYLRFGERVDQRPYLASFRASDLTPSSRFAAEPDGWVYDLQPDGSGGVWVAGDFGHLGDVSSRGIGHLSADGTAEPGLPGTDLEGAGSIALNGSTLYVSDLYEFGGIRYPGTGAMRLSDRSATTFAPGIGGRALTALPSGEVLIGGGFRSTSHNASSGIAWVNPDGTTAVPIGGGDSGTGDTGSPGGSAPEDTGDGGDEAAGGSGGDVTGGAGSGGGDGTGGTSSGGGLVGAGNGGPGGALVGGAPDRGATDGRASIRVSIASRRLAGGTVAVRVSSSTGGRVTVRVRLAGGQRTVLGRATVTLRAGVVRTVKVRLPARAARKTVVAEAGAAASRSVRLG